MFFGSSCAHTTSAFGYLRVVVVGGGGEREREREREREGNVLI
jgi:hypothetical protein